MSTETSSIEGNVDWGIVLLQDVASVGMKTHIPPRRRQSTPHLTDSAHQNSWPATY
jgi:hypothetical protein